jgi:hypothetical protein
MLLARNGRDGAMDRVDVFDDTGRRVGSVTRPVEPRMFGPHKGTVYLSRPLPGVAPGSSAPAPAPGAVLPPPTRPAAHAA